MKENRVYLEHIAQNIAHVQRLASEGKQSFLEDSDRQAAILFYLHTMAESAGRLSDELKAKQSHVGWNQIKGFRNIIVHDYLSVDLDRVWNIIENNLPELFIAVKALLYESDAEADEKN